ncbi:MAG: hypothetical protein AABX48_03375 [Nanoarchaeota archaeon]
MLQTKNCVKYNGKEFYFQSPLGIYLDGNTGRIHDAIIPKCQEIDPEKLVVLRKDEINQVLEDATRQLNGIAKKDSPEVRQAIRNTIDLTTRLL